MHLLFPCFVFLLMLVHSQIGPLTLENLFQTRARHDVDTGAKNASLNGPTSNGRIEKKVHNYRSQTCQHANS